MSDTMTLPGGPAAGDGPSTPPDNSAAAAAGGRDRRGRFSKGNKGGPGNPFARRTAAMRQALMDAVTDDDIAVIARKMVEQAREGNVAAARLVFTYVIGKPQPAEDPDRLDEKEWRQYVNETVREGEIDAVVGGMSTTLACTIAHATVPAMQEKAAQTLRAELLESADDEEDLDDEEEESEEAAAPAPRQDERAARSADAADCQRIDSAAARVMALLRTLPTPAENVKRAANRSETARGNARPATPPAGASASGQWRPEND
jgi:hypothetical protein